jgi:hypothetical protein
MEGDCGTFGGVVSNRTLAAERAAMPVALLSAHSCGPSMHSPLGLTTWSGSVLKRLVDKHSRQAYAADAGCEALSSHLRDTIIEGATE